MYNNLAYNRPAMNRNEMYGSIFSNRLGMRKPTIGQAPISRGRLKGTHIWVYINVPRRSDAVWVRIPKKNLVTKSYWDFDCVPSGQPKSYVIY